MAAIAAIPAMDTARIDEAFARQTAFREHLRSESPRKRKERLHRLRDAIVEYSPRVREAVFKDFGKNPHEAEISEILTVLAELRNALKHVETWARPTEVDTPLTYLGTSSEIRYEPKGTCLIISPWNYPFNLCMGPLVSALAAGNNAILKPSELTPHTSAVIRELVVQTFAQEEVWVAEGDAQVATYLLSLPFNHIFFTGSPGVGKVVMKAAATNLASVTLELGGKSPAVIDETANLRDAARRIAWGKLLNCGQTCLAPDYVMIHESRQAEFISLLKGSVAEVYGRGGAVTEASPDYMRIISDRHFQRLAGLLEDATRAGATVELGGSASAPSRFFPPVILRNAPRSSRVMQEEIFGPILPVNSYRDVSEVVGLINNLPAPLSAYIFSRSRKFREHIVTHTSAGAVVVNDCVVHFSHEGLPFGGVNNSGIGRSHGYHGFLAFSNEKPVLRQKSGFTSLSALYPPYTGATDRIIRFMKKWVY
jgi:aldehyde dehydrogenase (NAD+)